MNTLSLSDCLIVKINTMDVALLVRVSSADQNHERQTSELTTFANDKGYNVVEVIEETISGAKKNSERKGIQRLLQLAKSKKIRKVVIHEVTRLGRDTQQVLTTMEELHGYKVSVHVMNYNLETLNPDGSVNPMAQFLFTILADIGRMERITLVERTKSGMENARRNGKQIGRPEGSIKSPYVILKEYSKVVRTLKEGHSIRNTAKICGVGISTVQRVKKSMVNI